MPNDGTILLRSAASMYRDAARDSNAVLIRHVWMILLVPAYTAVIGLVAGLAGQLGILGGIVMFLVAAACLSSFLSVIGDAVTHQRVLATDLGQGFGRHLGTIATIFFIFWIIHLLLAMIVAQDARMTLLAIAINCGIFLIFNAVPEMIYQGQRDGLGLLEDSVQFLRDNWMEWMTPLALILAPVFLADVGTGFLAMSELGGTTALAWATKAIAIWLPVRGGASAVIATFVASALIVWIMLFRGFLFRALSRTGRRQRLFEARMRGL